MATKKLPLTLRLYKSHTISELRIFVEYINYSKEKITSLQNEFEEKYEAGIQPVGYAEDEPTEDYWRYEHYKFHDALPSFYRKTIFFGLYSFFETRLLSLCGNLHRLKDYKIKPSDLSGDDYLARSKKYLNLVVNINTDDLNHQWSKIRDYQKIRNCLVHNNGTIKKEKEIEWRGIVERVQNMSLDSSQIAIEDDKFLLNFIELINQYIITILEKININCDFE